MSDKKQTNSKISALEAQAQEYLAGWQRAQADYANLKNDFENREKEIREYACAGLMAQMLPIYNHFKLALKHIPEKQKKQDWIVGIEHIQKQFQDFLRTQGIEEIKTVGEQFDPNRHEAVVCEENQEFESDRIFEEIQPGYLVDGKVLIPAKVKVSQ